MPRFVIGGMRPDVADHVWCEVYCDWNDTWLPLDPTNEKATPGWYQEFPYQLHYEIWQQDEDNSVCLTFLLGIIAAVYLTR